MYSNVENIFVVGDLNGRTGEIQDIISGVDAVEKRATIDKGKNQHGQDLLEFLIESKMCMVNGRLNDTDPSFTCVLTKGSSVVDYILVPHDCLENCLWFGTFQTNELTDTYNLQPFLSDRCKAPDHALLTVIFKDTKYIESNNTGSFICSSLSRVKTKRFNFQMTTSMFMNDKTWNDNMILLNTCFEEKEGIDIIYEQIQTCLQYEMDNKLLVLNSSRKGHSKPYWDNDKFCGKQCVGMRNVLSKVQIKQLNLFKG